MKIFALCWLAGCVPQIAEQQAPIVDGTLDSADPAVVFMEEEEARKESFCSGSLISPTVVLTAAHCVVEGERNQHSLFVQTGSARYSAKEVVNGSPHSHPAYDPATGLNDVGVVVLNRPFCELPAPLPFNRTPLDASLIGQTLRTVGFGLTSKTDTTPLTKRTTQLTITDVDAQSVTEVDGTPQTCYGDSGGPLFYSMGGVETIIGVTSRGDDQCLNLSIFQRVDTVTDFLDPFLAASPSPVVFDCTPPAPHGCSAMPGTTSAPELLPLLLLLLGFRRRGRSAGAVRPTP